MVKTNHFSYGQRLVGIENAVQFFYPLFLGAFRETWTLLAIDMNLEAFQYDGIEVPLALQVEAIESGIKCFGAN